MPSDYYVILTTGVVAKVAGVTATPTITNQTMAQGVYRDVFQNFPATTATSLQAPGWSLHPTYTGPSVDTYTVVLDDISLHVDPRSLTWPESHWTFQLASGNDYYIPTRYVVAMSTDQPTI